MCLKNSGPRILLDAIAAAIDDAPYCDPAIDYLINHPKRLIQDHNLTEQEVDVLVRLDLRNKEISEELGMKLRAVEQLVENILRKFDSPTRTAAAIKAVQFGFQLLPKMSARSAVTGMTDEELMAEKHAVEAINKWRKEGPS